MTLPFTLLADEFIDRHDAPSAWPLRHHVSAFGTDPAEVSEPASRRHQLGIWNPIIVRATRFHTEAPELDELCTYIDPHKVDLFKVWSGHHEYAYGRDAKELNGQLDMLPNPEEVSTVVRK